MSILLVNCNAVAILDEITNALGKMQRSLPDKSNDEKLSVRFVFKWCSPWEEATCEIL